MAVKLGDEFMVVLLQEDLVSFIVDDQFERTNVKRISFVEAFFHELWYCNDNVAHCDDFHLFKIGGDLDLGF